MRIDSAIALINQIVYKPGYTLEAVDHTKRFEGTVKVTLRYVAPETGRDNAAQGYPEIISTYAEFPVAVGDLTGPAAAVCLYRRILDAILQVESHEAREALRVQPTLWSPFHPHTLDGIDQWNATASSTQRPELVADFQFGIA
jgi:hypothetical protein